MIEKVKRKIAEVRKKSNSLRKYVPNGVIRCLKNLEDVAVRSAKEVKHVNHESKYVNIYHVALQKTGTQWLNDVFSDPVVYKYSGMKVEKFDIPRRKSQAHEIHSIGKPYPKNTIITGIGCTFSNYKNDIPKNKGKDAVVFVVRDPREMIVSWYFSTKDNHLVDPASMMAVHRRKLKEMSKDDGIEYVIDLFQWKGKFEVMRSWLNQNESENLKIVKFEDIVSGSVTTFGDIFSFMDAKVPSEVLERLVYDYSFEKLTGRSRGAEDTSSHMRSGVATTWKSHLSDSNLRLLYDHAGDLVKGFGYE